MDGVLLDYQRRWIAEPAEVRVYEKSRRIGITWAEAAAAVLAAARRDRPVDTIYISYNLEMTREFLIICAEWASHYGLAAGEVGEVVIRDEDEDITVYRLQLASGGRVLGVPSRPTVLRGRQGRVVVDEAAFVENLAEILKAALAMLMWGGEVSVISTHDGAENRFAELVADVRAGRLPYALHRTDIEDAIADGLYRRICARRRLAWSPEGERQWLAELVATYGDAAQEELYCRPREGGSSYFSRALIEAAMRDDIPVAELRRDPQFTRRPESEREADVRDWIEECLESPLAAARERAAGERLRSYLGMDFARSGHLSVIALLVETPRLDLESVIWIEMRDVPFAQQLQVLCALIDGAPRFSGGAIDARGNGQMLAELVAQRYSSGLIHEVMTTRKTYAEGMPPYRARYEDRTITVPRHAGLLDDHRLVTLDHGGLPHIADRVQDPGGDPRHGDGAVAGMLAVYAVRHDESGYHPYRYHPIAVTQGQRWRDSAAGDDDE